MTSDLDRYDYDLEPAPSASLVPLGYLSREVRSANRYVARKTVRMQARQRVAEAALDAIAEITDTAMDGAETIVEAAQSRLGTVPNPALLQALAAMTDDGIRDLRRVRARFARGL